MALRPRRMNRSQGERAYVEHSRPRLRVVRRVRRVPAWRDVRPAAHTRLHCSAAYAGVRGLFVCGIGAIARMYVSGAKLGIMSPLLAAVIPLGVIAIGILAYNESASPLRIALLLGACGLIGAASIVA